MSNPTGNQLYMSSSWPTKPIATTTVYLVNGRSYTLNLDINGFSVFSGYTHTVRVRVLLPSGASFNTDYTSTGTKTITFTSNTTGYVTIELRSIISPSNGVYTVTPYIDIDNFKVAWDSIYTTNETTCTIDSSKYRYGFNGMEKDQNVGNEGDYYTAEFWEYDSRLGRRWNVDPVYKFELSNYSCFYNNPIRVIDPNGDDGYVDENGSYLGDDGNTESHETRVISAEAWKTIVGDKETITEEMRSGLVASSTLLTDYKKGIRITESTWDKLVENGGEKLDPWVVNNSKHTVFAKSEEGSEVFEIDPNTDLYVTFNTKDGKSGIDGVAAPHLKKGSVFKVVTGTSVTVTDTKLKYSSNWDFSDRGAIKRSFRRWGANLMQAEWKDRAWLELISADVIFIDYYNWKAGNLMYTEKIEKGGDKQWVDIFVKSGLENAELLNDYYQHYMKKYTE